MRNKALIVFIERLDPRAQDKGLVLKLNRITARCFGKEVPLHETEERFAAADELFVLRQGERVVGYAFNDHLGLAGARMIYFGSGFIDPDAQGGGLYARLNSQRVMALRENRECFDGLMTRTQNPRVVSGFVRISDQLGLRVSPGIDRSMDPRALEIARAYAPDCTDGMVCKRVYGRELMARTPEAEGIAKALLSDADTKLGDAVILVGLK